MTVGKTQLIFVLPQAGDIATTMIAIQMGGAEKNTLVAHFMMAGSLQGLLFSKAIVLAIAVAAVRRGRSRVLLWVVFSCVVSWNLYIIARLALQ